MVITCSTQNIDKLSSVLTNKDDFQDAKSGLPILYNVG